MALTFSQLGAADFGLAIAFGTLVLFVGSFVVYKTTTRLSGAQATSTIVSVWLAWIFSIAYFLLLALSQGYIALSRTQRSQHINAAGIQTSPATESQASSTIGSQAGLAAAAFESLTISAWIFALTSLTYVLLNRAETTIPKHMPIVRIALPFVVGCSTLAPILAVIYTSKYDIISSQALFGLEITDAILRFLATLLLMVVTARCKREFAPGGPLRRPMNTISNSAVFWTGVGMVNVIVTEIEQHFEGEGRRSTTLLPRILATGIATLGTLTLLPRVFSVISLTKEKWVPTINA